MTGTDKASAGAEKDFASDVELDAQKAGSDGNRSYGPSARSLIAPDSPGFSWAAVCQAAAFVAVWGAIGVGLQLSGLTLGNAGFAYLLIGIPLVILFQTFVRGKPLVTLWQRNAERYRLDRWGLLVAVGLAVLPGLSLLRALVSRLSWTVEVYLAAAVVGAFGAAFCMRSTTRRDLRNGFPAFLAATAIGVAIMHLIATRGGGKSALFDLKQLGFGAGQFLMLLPVCFVMEEVAFRGMLDAHVQPVVPAGKRRWTSAAIVSILWGLWHLPFFKVSNIAPLVIAQLIAVHLLVGVPLSFCWRSSGSLLLPAAAHALIDAFRNAVGLM